jgi:hypothetical protein
VNARDGFTQSRKVGRKAAKKFLGAFAGLLFAPLREKQETI